LICIFRKKIKMTALILGGTGLVGNQLVQLLIEDKRFETVELLARRELDQRELKVLTHVVDFNNLENLPLNSKVDVLFIAFGSTIKKAGSQAK
jgi:aspartate-semialdehyde dehydrogenase